jgi:glycosyltransferase involved in cell wall biosynthesis
VNDLTIVIPTIYRDTLGRAIESVQSQTVPTELVIISDLERTGAGPTMNRAVRAVESDFVGFLADDDRLHVSAHEWWLEAGGLEADLFIFTMQYADGRKLPVTTDAAKLGLGNVGGSFILRKGVVERFPFIREEVNRCYHEDWQMIAAVREKGFRIIVSSRVGYYIRH